MAPPRDVAHLWSSLFAGAGSGALSSVVCAPLDLLRTRMQVWGDLNAAHTHETAYFFLRNIYLKEGWQGYFRGLGATLATVPLFWGIYFPLYDDIKRTLSQHMHSSALVHCTSAIAAGAVADILCNPMFVVRTRLQTEALHSSTSTSILGTVSKLYQEGGVTIFWRGLTASLMGLSHVAVQFPVYEWFKQQARNYRDDGIETPLDLLFSSGLSKVVACVTTYPHEVVRSRMMDAREGLNVRLGPTVQRIWQQEGLIGFYSGLHVSLLRVVPNCCVTFLTYELLCRFAKEKIAENRLLSDKSR